MLSINVTEKAYLHVFEGDCGEAYQLREESFRGVGSHSRRKGDSSFSHIGVLMPKKGHE